MFKKIIIRAAVLIVVFVGAIVGTSIYMNKDTPDTTEVMRGASLPLVYMLSGDRQLNPLHGYVKEMDVTAMRDALTPIDSQRILNIQIQPFQTKVSDIEFEVLTSDGKTSLENTKVTKTQEDENYLSATLEFQNKTLMNTEYMLKIALTVGERKIYYYTRIIREDGLNVDAYLDFATGFYERCINNNNLETIAEAMDPNDTMDNASLAYVNINSSMEQLAWKDLNPQPYYKPTPSIRELNEITATIVMDYMISATGEEDEVELYHVVEYYRLRYTDTRVRLLNFERETSEIFRPQKSMMTEQGLKLGIAGKEVTYKNDTKKNYFVFVREGALWSYDLGGNKITQVFSFPQEKNSDPRDVYNQNDIEIINIDEQGNMYFLVCGYMNRGAHEGESGAAVYYYEEASGTINECLFVDTDQAYPLLKRDLETLAYISEDRQMFYMVLDGEVYGINMETRQAEKVVSDLKTDCYAGSRSGKWFAWLKENDKYNSSTIVLIDLDTRQTREITSGDNQKLQVLGFIEEDLIYGLADEQDIERDHPGNEWFPMNEVRIVTPEGAKVKEYFPRDSFVFGARVEDKRIALTRMKRSGDRYEEIAEDYIVSSVEDEESTYGLTSRGGQDDRKQTETVLNVGKSLSNVDMPQVVTSRQVIYEGSKEIVLETKARDENMYYVYAKGALDSMYTSVNLAIQKADEELGVVVSGQQQVVWERGNRKEKLDLDVTTFPQPFLTYQLDVSKLQSQMDQKILDLSGCTLEQVLYFVSQGTPVMANTPDGPVIIGGYDEFNTRLLYQGEDELEYFGIEDSTEMFEAAGNVFIGYLDPLTE